MRVHDVALGTAVLVLTSVTLSALSAQATDVGGRARAQSVLEDVLGSDGTIDLQKARLKSFDVRGWRAVADSGNGLKFVKASQPAQADTQMGMPAHDVAGVEPLDSNGVDGIIYCIAVDASGNLYVGGNFQSAGGVACNYIAKWDGTNWSPLGSGMDAGVEALAFDPLGNLYAGGEFTSAGGVTCNKIAKWNGTSWSPLGSGMDSAVDALVWHPSGCLYAGGYFNKAGDVWCHYIAKWDGTSWSALGSGMNSDVLALTVDPAGNLYAGGFFTTAGGVTCNGVAKWNGASWSALGDGIGGGDPQVYALAFDRSSGILFAAGSFTMAGGVPCSRIAKWNGVGWAPLGTGMSNSVYSLVVDSSGNLYAGGSFGTAGGVTCNRIAVWNRVAWSALGSGISGGSDPYVRCLTRDALDNIYVGGLFTTAGGIPCHNLAKWDGTSWSSPDAPPNDVFANRMRIVGASGSVSASNVRATKESGEPDHALNAGGKSVWWTWTAPATGTVTFETCGSSFNTLLALYTGTSLSALWPAGSNDDSCGSQSRVTISVTAGYTYQIAVDGYGGASGNIVLSWSLSSNCGHNIMPSTATFGPDGGTGSGIVWTGSGCQWAASPDVSWITITNGSTGTGNGTFGYSVAPNPDLGSRTGHIAVGTAVQTVTQSAGGDLVLGHVDFSPSAPTAVQPGSPLSCSWPVSGPWTAGNNIWLELFASTDGGFTLERFGGTITQSYPIPHGGGSVVYTPGNQVVNTLPDGIYTVVGSVNRKGTSSVEESDFADNWWPVAGKRLYVHNTTTPVCDLQWQSAPSVSLVGQALTVTGTIRNGGSGASPSYGFWVEVAYGTLTPEGFMYIAGRLPGTHYGSLAAGGTASFSQTATIPAGYPVIAVMIDSTDLVPETNEQNNFYVNQSPPTQSGTVDLEVLSVTIGDSYKAPHEVSPGSTLPFTIQVRNNSSVASGNVWIELFGSKDGGLTFIRAGTTFTESSMVQVPANSTQTFSLTPKINAIADGLYTLVAVVNRSGTGGPTDPVPGNNKKAVSGRVLLHNSTASSANLLWSDGPAISQSGDQVTVSGTIRNAGSGASGPFWTELFGGNIGEDAVFYTGGTLTGGAYCTGLAPGATLSYSQTASLPAWVSVVGVLIDSTDIVPESDETDNYEYMQP